MSDALNMGDLAMTGVQQPKPQTPKQQQQRRDLRHQAPDTARRIEPLDARTLQSIDTLISSYDEHQIEMRAPNALETPSRQAFLPVSSCPTVVRSLVEISFLPSFLP